MTFIDSYKPRWILLNIRFKFRIHNHDFRCSKKTLGHHLCILFMHKKESWPDLSAFSSHLICRSFVLASQIGKVRESMLKQEVFGTFSRWYAKSRWSSVTFLWRTCQRILEIELIIKYGHLMEDLVLSKTHSAIFKVD